MARKVKATGRCRICGQDGDLSFEHVPPQKAFNDQRLIAYSVEGHITKKEVKGRQLQRGAGAYTLCEQCNNSTGAWYANEFVKWSQIGADVLQVLQQQKEQFSNLSEIMVVFQDVYPVRFLKQIVTCFFSVMGANTDAAFATMNPDLVRFVLNREESNLPESYHFYLKLYQKSVVSLSLRDEYHQAQETSVRLPPRCPEMARARDSPATRWYSRRDPSG